MSTRDDKSDTSLDGQSDPTEEVGPEGCQPSAEDCAVIASDDETDKPENSEYDPNLEVAEQFAVTTIGVGIDPTDGLPLPMDGQELALAPKFGIDSLVCLEDTRAYVELWDDEWISYRESRADHAVLAAAVNADVRERHDERGVERVRQEFAPDTVVKLWGATFVRTSAFPLPPMEGAVPLPGQSAPGLKPVRARRERCKFYGRQILSNDDVPDPTDFGHRIVFRNCTARRSVGGAFMSLRDQCVYACDYRDPPDPASVERELDAPDRKRLTEVIEQVPLWNLT